MHLCWRKLIWLQGETIVHLADHIWLSWLQQILLIPRNLAKCGVNSTCRITLTRIPLYFFSLLFLHFSLLRSYFPYQLTTFLYTPPNFLYLPYSTLIGVCSLLSRYIHPFGLYRSSLQPAHFTDTSPSTTPPPLSSVIALGGNCQPEMSSRAWTWTQPWTLPPDQQVAIILSALKSLNELWKMPKLRLLMSCFQPLSHRMSFTIFTS